MRPSTSTRLTLIRHGEPAATAIGTHYGQSDVDLSETGRYQSIRVAKELETTQFDSIWSSDLIRARFLADRLAETRGLEVRVHNDLRERYMGKFQGLTYAEAEAAFPFETRTMRREIDRPPGGENMSDLTARVVPAIEAIAREHEGCRVAIAGHGGPIRAILGYVLGMPLDHLNRLRVGYCSISEIEIASIRMRVLRVNA